MGNLVISQPPISSAFSLWQSSLPSPNLPFSGGTPATRRVSFGGAIPPLLKRGNIPVQLLVEPVGSLAGPVRSLTEKNRSLTDLSKD